MAQHSRNRGRKKPTLRDLGRIPLTPEQASEQFERLPKIQEPIVTAILGQALLENELDVLLRGHFTRNDDATWNTLTDDRAPLATFHNKIIAAYAFGIFDEVILDSLNTIRAIRNAFAHSKIHLDFSHELIVGKLTTITLPQRKRSKLCRALSDIRATARKRPDRAQAAYVALCAIMAIQLLKTQIKRGRARSRRYRYTKKYRNDLARALIGNQPEPQASFVRGILAGHNDDPSFLEFLASPSKIDR